VGTQLCPTERGTAVTAAPHFLAHVHCGQTVAHLSNCWALVITHKVGIEAGYLGPAHTNSNLVAIFHAILDRNGTSSGICAVVEIVILWRLQSLISLLMLVSKNVYVLINFVCFSESVFVTLSVVSLFVLRWSRPNMYRPIKVWFVTVALLIAVYTHHFNSYFLWSPYGIGQTIIFSSCRLFFLLLLLFFFPRLISATADWMPAILPHMVWP